MANIKVAEENKKNSITLSITNHVHVTFRETCEDKGLNWSHETERLMVEYILKHKENGTEEL